MDMMNALCASAKHNCREFVLAYERWEYFADRQRSAVALSMAAQKVFALTEFGLNQISTLSEESRDTLQQIEAYVAGRLADANLSRNDDGAPRARPPLTHRQPGLAKTLDVLNGLLNTHIPFSVQAQPDEHFLISVFDCDQDEFLAILKAYDAEGFAQVRKVDAFGRHEMLDRTHCVQLMLQELLLERNDLPAPLREQLENASSALGDAYQLAGNLPLND